MKNLNELLKGKDEVWFELKREDFFGFIQFAKKNNLKWITPKTTFDMTDFRNCIEYAHLSVDKNKVVAFVPMFLWVSKTAKEFRIENAYFETNK